MKLVHVSMLETRMLETGTLEFNNCSREQVFNYIAQ